jgi:hypothetical protein
MGSVIYVMSDLGLPGACKVGKNQAWPSRYVQARCHTPRGLRIEGVFGFDGRAAMEEAESAAKRELSHVRRVGDVVEWFDLAASAAIERLLKAGILRQQDALPMIVKLSRAERFYDDWREQRSKFLAFRWRLWLFEEQSPERRLKLSYGALYDTAYRYAFTYNPWPVRLIAGFEHRAGVEDVNLGNEGPNREIRSSWERVQAAFGNLASEQVGWLLPSVQPSQVAQRLAADDIHSFRLDRPKPAGAPPRDASLNPPTPIGTIPSQDRVKASVEVEIRTAV